MKRRDFFSSLLGGAIAAHELDMEKLLWVPGAKTIFIPPALPDNSSIWLVMWGENMVRVLFYGNTLIVPQAFTGLAPKYKGNDQIASIVERLREANA